MRGREMQDQDWSSRLEAAENRIDRISLEIDRKDRAIDEIQHSYQVPVESAVYWPCQPIHLLLCHAEPAFPAEAQGHAAPP